jgi:hypothetical protein
MIYDGNIFGGKATFSGTINNKMFMGVFFGGNFCNCGLNHKNECKKN